jgi:hypothetical protein
MRANFQSGERTIGQSGPRFVRDLPGDPPRQLGQRRFIAGR